MASLTGGRADSELLSASDWGARVAGDTIAIQQHQLFDTRLPAEAVNHLRDQRAVIVQHRVLERGMDQFAFGKSIRPRQVKDAVEVMNRVDVCSYGAGSDHGHGHTDGEANGHAGEAQLHKMDPEFFAF